MKKVLLGLVIAVMMTGSSYSAAPIRDKNLNIIKFEKICDFLEAHAIKGVTSSMKKYNNYAEVYEKFVRANTAEYDQNKQTWRKQMYEYEDSSKIESETFFFASTWSALCD